VWRAKEGDGSVFREDGSDNQLLWMADGRLVFPWERDGWLHLYSVPDSVGTTEGKATLLTPGNFEIEHVTASTDRKTVVFSSNQDDSERRHLWQVPAAGGRVERLTDGQGIEWSPAALNDGRVALFHSDARMPPRAALRDAGGTLRDLAPQTIPASFPQGALVEPRPVVFPAADGMEIHGQLFLPPGGAAKHPAVVFFHGGSRRQMLLGWHYMLYYNQTYGFNQYLASQGYVVLSVNYRGGIGYGMKFREALGFGASGGSEYKDVVGAGRYLASRPDVDAQRIGAWGGSYGGYLTALALARSSDVFKVGVDFHGVHDWRLEIGHFPGDPQRQADLAKIAFESSPMAFLSTWRSPVLVVQGDDDRNVLFSQSVQLIEALRKQAVPFEQLIFPDEIHDFLVYGHWVAAYHAAADYLARYLNP
jgi:dipeptidyl aminopeptidase/acylaminoacyl peptidase